MRAARHHPVVVLVTCRDPVRVGDLHGLPKLVLSALDDEAVAEIVRIYAPSTTTATAAAAMVNAGGVPARVHRHASEWAFERAGRRIDRAVVDAAAPAPVARGDARPRSSAASSILPSCASGPGCCEPRPGPRSSVRSSARPGSRPLQAELFHGRERLVADALARLVRAPMLAVVGDAGTGKSSMVRAGLLPALAAGVLPGVLPNSGGRWQHVLVTPTAVRGPLGEHLQTLAAARAAEVEAARSVGAEPVVTAESVEPTEPAEPAEPAELAEGAEPAEVAGPAEAPPAEELSAVLLLVVDQFDEVFTALGPAERDEFVATVVAAAASGRVVLTMRPQAYARCVAHPELTRLVGANTLLVPAMTAAELHNAVRRPAALAGLELSAGLADRVVADALATSGDLTSFSTALRGTWVHRNGRTLTPDAYVAAGRVERAVEVYAEAVYGALTAAEA